MKKNKISEQSIRIMTLKAFIVAIVGYLTLFIFDLKKVIQVQVPTWIMIGVILAVIAVQWMIFVWVLHSKGIPTGRNKGQIFLKWLAIFSPIIIFVLALCGIYISPLKNQSPFAMDLGNVFASLGVFFSASAVCLLIILSIELIINMINASKNPDYKKQKGKKSADVKETLVAKVESNQKTTEQEEKIIFPDLLSIDKNYKAHPYKPAQSVNWNLKELCSHFNNYLESKGMYYAPETIRGFVAGMACSHFIILEGLSGTGKTSLPKYFAKFFGSNVCFTSVQASWRDRSDILGYYNDFSEKFKETPFLRNLYEASYTKDKINLMVLDEMNLSRVEYYFADFLSVLELSPENQAIELMPISTTGKLPKALCNGCSVKIPQNTWFIGTANRDDSTFTITDKVYDRAMVIDFVNRNQPTVSNFDTTPVYLGEGKLETLFSEAIKSSEFNSSSEDYKKFTQLSEFMLDTFNINFGNRILNQIMKYVPVFMECGGSGVKALDMIFARKILRKLEGRFEDGLKSNLTKLEKLIISLYGKEEFSISLDAISKFKRKLI